MDAGNEVDDAEGVTRLRRRTVIRGAAWAVPVIAVAVAAPATAASAFTCPPVSAAAEWAVAIPARDTSGEFTTSGNAAWVSIDGRSAWQLSKDNRSATQDAFAETFSEIDMVSGATYTFMIEVAANYLNNTPPNPGNMNIGGQSIQIRLNGISVQDYTTRAAWSGGTQISMGTSGSRQWNTFTFTYTATSSGPVAIDYFNRLAPGLSNDDILVAMPVLVSCVV
ncbi:hypothetical protein [Microbacterium sp. NPDC057650]